MKHKENADQCTEALKDISYKSHVIVTHYWCGNKTCLNHSYYCLSHNDIYEVLDFNIINAWLMIMFNDEATLHVSLISMKTKSADQLKKRTFTTFTLFTITSSSSLSLMFNMTTSSSIQIYTTLLSALSLTLIFSHSFSDLKAILNVTGLQWDQCLIDNF